MMMMHYTFAEALGQGRVHELRDQARRDALARSARLARRAGRPLRARYAPGFLVAFARQARHRQPAPESLS